MSERALAAKRESVEAMKEKIARARLAVISDYAGFTVKELTELRKKLRSEEAELTVFKNTLLERAVEATGFTAMKQHLKGPTAILLGYRDAVAPLKLLVKFLKDTEKGKLRAGVVEKTVFNEKELGQIAALPPREALIGKVVGGMKAPLYGLVNVLQGPIRKLVYALNAVQDKKKGGE